MKQEIDPKDIRKGDLIRFEYDPTDTPYARAVEYVSSFGGGSPYTNGQYYLLDRFEPPFEPYWGMVIGDPDDISRMAVYIPAGGEKLVGWLCSEGLKWIGDEAAKQKLAEGWVEIKKPEGVK